MVKFEKYLDYFILFFAVLTLFRTCGVSSEIKTVKKELEMVKTNLRMVDSSNIKKDEMVRLIKETPNWKTLEIEELSDKNKIPINYYKNMD